LAAGDRILEINSNEGVPPPRGPNPGPVVVRWWHEEGGAAVSFGSDAHRPDRLACGLSGAAAAAEAAGFKPSADPLAFWRR
jgi:histidinol-phosphatase (PHP family)